MLTTHSDIKAVTMALMREERVEKGMIELYKGLLESGAAACLPRQADRGKFVKLIKTLYEDSVEHQRIIFDLLVKYQDL